VTTKNLATDSERNLRQQIGKQLVSMIRVVIDLRNPGVRRVRGASESLAERGLSGGTIVSVPLISMADHQVNLDSQISSKGEDPAVVANLGT
jgi:hypothetical protein